MSDPATSRTPRWRTPGAVDTTRRPDIDWARQTWLDGELQRQRIAQVRRWIEPGSRVLDIGCGDGALFRGLGGRLSEGVGLDPRLRAQFDGPGWALHPGEFPDDLPRGPTFDAIALVAVLEHLPGELQGRLGPICHALLRPNGRVIITVPSPTVDRLLAVLIRLRLVGGQAESEHWGFDPAGTPALFPSPLFTVLASRSFQFGLNRLFVFERA